MGSDRGAPSVPPALPVPATTAGRTGLRRLLAHPARAVVALDFDGTLAPIVPDPDRARAHPGAVPALARLAPQVAAVAVVTGRPAERAVRYGGFAGVTGLDGLVVLGAYGAERWEAATGELTSPPPHPGVAAVREELPNVLAAAGADPGVHVEDKGGAVAVHTRRAAEPSVAFRRLRAPLTDLAGRHGLTVEPGRAVLELRPPGTDKGAAVTGLARAAGAGTVVYAGDDLGDLAAFAAVEELRAEGLHGLLVCSGSDEVTALAERADLVVDGPDGVVALLDALADALAAHRGR
ncbi:trehalose-phosphatase [Streptomyces sp. TR06-5]|uniref:trehalose-phosphatase n=1 Tax=Streptomyces sp. TR06-5 TaxID=3385976 RepID=UPI0039A3A430